MESLADGTASAALTDAIGELSCYLNDVAAGLFGKLTDADVLAELREFEVLRRRLAVVDHALVAELGRRALAGRLVLGSTSELLQAVLRLSSHEAKQRVSASELCGPRWSLTGERLETLLPEVAAAQAAGVVSPEHARVIASTLEELPGSVDPADVSAAEQHLVKAAAQLRPRQVGLLGQRILAQLDPDGVLASEEEHARRRSFALIPEANGGYRATGRLTPECGALLHTWLTPRSAPRPAADADADEHTSALVADPRSHGQRMHDALQELAGMAVRRTELVDSGAPAQVIISMTVDQLSNREGWAETSFGQLMSVDQALKLADEAAITLLLRDARGVVLRHGRTKRVATRGQTLALIARDRGCSFPDCDKPPEWCQRHHIVAWADGGTTDLDNLTLVCGRHHRDFAAAGWSCQLIDGLPSWIPPAWDRPCPKAATQLPHQPTMSPAMRQQPSITDEPWWRIRDGWGDAPRFSAGAGQAAPAAATRCAGHPAHQSGRITGRTFGIVGTLNAGPLHAIGPLHTAVASQPARLGRGHQHLVQPLLGGCRLSQGLTQRRRPPQAPGDSEQHHGQGRHKQTGQLPSDAVQRYRQRPGDQKHHTDRRQHQGHPSPPGWRDRVQLVVHASSIRHRRRQQPTGHPSSAAPPTSHPPAGSLTLVRIARFVHPGGIAWGVVEAPAAAGQNPSFDSLTVAAIKDHPMGPIEFTGERFAIGDVRLLAPILPSKVIAVGRNYAAHAAELGNDVPERPLIFLKPSTSVIGTRDVIRLPVDSDQVEHEAELALVIGRVAKDVPREQALGVVFGYTCANDVTARDQQRADVQFTRSKSYDSFCPIGPWIDTTFDPSAARVRALVNGVTKQDGNTRDMIFDVATIVSFMSHVMTLVPGDVILTGTPEGVGRITDGDTVTIAIDGLGELTNPVRSR